MSEPEPQEDVTPQQLAGDELAFPDLRPGIAWGESITKQRAAELEAKLQQWEAEKEHGKRKGPFDITLDEYPSISISGADVFWLAARTLAKSGNAQAITVQVGSLTNPDNHPTVSDLHLEGADLFGAHLDGADLNGAHLEHATLIAAQMKDANLDGARLEAANLSVASLEGAAFTRAHLEGADLGAASLVSAYFSEAYLEGAHLSGADLKGAYLIEACLKGAHLLRANLKNADLSKACLEGANLAAVRLKGACLVEANLRGANLMYARLKGADFNGAHLSGADVRFAILDSATNLKTVILDDEKSASITLADTRWGDVNLAVVGWTRTTRGFLRLRKRIEAIELGDERQARNPDDSDSKPKDKATRLQEYKDAVRANRQLATALRQQGLNEDADRFAYKAQTLQREVLRRQGNFGGYAFSLLLWALSGYGYRLWRIAAAYGLVLVVFAVIFLILGVHSHSGEPGIQAFWDSFLVSLSAIHGRTIFEQLGAWSAAAWAAAVESVVGIVIEGVFVAMLIQRFFGR